MISVVIPLYNKEAYITATIESVLAQSFQDFEIIIVNDGSTDGSVAKVKAFTDNRIRLIHQENGGVSVARNRGIEEAKYEWVALLDGDDLWKPEYLQTLWNLHLKYPECRVCATNYEFMDHTGRVTPTKINKLPFTGEDGILSNYFEVAACSHPPIWTSAVMIQHEAIQSVGGFPVGVKSGEDLLTWARLAVRYQIVYSKTICSTYKLGRSISRPPEPIDLIGKQLEEITYNKGVKCYIAYWYKMRMCRCLAHGMFSAALLAFYKSVRYNPFQLKIYLSILLYTYKSL